MTTVTIEDAQIRLPELARAVEGGETVVVTRDGEPILDLDLVPHPPERKGGIDWEGGRRCWRRMGSRTPSRT